MMFKVYRHWNLWICSSVKTEKPLIECQLTLNCCECWQLSCQARLCLYCEYISVLFTLEINILFHISWIVDFYAGGVNMYLHLFLFVRHWEDTCCSNHLSWWRHQLETFSALLELCANSPHKGQWRGALMFPLICAWSVSWVKRYAGDMRRYRTHYDVTVMITMTQRSCIDLATRQMTIGPIQYEDTVLPVWGFLS